MTSRLGSRCSSAKISGSTYSSSTSGTERAARPLLLGAASALLLAAGCGVTVKRDLSETKPSEVVFDDMCGLQEYFDALKDTTLEPPGEVFANDIQADDKNRPSGGRKRFKFETEFQLHYLRQILETNWKSVPIEVAKASRVELEVSWSEKAGVARVVTDDEAVLSVGPKDWTIPYHVCLSDFLFGESLYDTRRAMLKLPDPVRSRFSTAKQGPVVPVPAAAPHPSAPSAPPAASPQETGSSAPTVTTSVYGRVPQNPVASSPAPAAPSAAPGAAAAAAAAAAGSPQPTPPPKPDEEVYSD
jgi:hypothetical protein